MKRKLAIVIIFALLITATACGKKLADADNGIAVSVSVETTSADITASTEVSLPEEKTEPEAEPVTADYSEVLNRIYEYLMDFDFFYGDFKVEEGLTGVSEYVFYSARELTATKVLGYAITDLSGDGIDELMIVGDVYGTNSGINILGIYGFVDGEPVLLKEGYSRDALYLLKDNVILEVGSFGAGNIICGEYSVSSAEKKLNVLNYYFSYIGDDGRDIVYQNETGEPDPDNSYVMEKGIDEFLSDIEAKCESANEINVESFADYKYTGSNDYSGRSPAVITTEYYVPAGPYILNYSSPEDGVTKDKPSLLIISTDVTVSNLTLWGVSVLDIDEKGEILYGYEEKAHLGFETYEEAKYFDPEEEIIVSLAFHGDMPEYAFSYRDTNGEFKRFLVYQSGQDGSICMSYVD